MAAEDIEEYVRRYLNGMANVIPKAYENSQDTFDDLFYQWGRQKIQAREIGTQSLANLSYVDKVAVARARGLDARERSKVTPFPAPISVNYESGNKELVEKLTEQLGALANQQQQAESPTDTPKAEPMSFWKKVLLAGTAGTALTIPPALAYWLGTGSEDKPPEQAQEVVEPVTDDKLGEVDMVIKRWTEKNQNNQP